MSTAGKIRALLALLVATLLITAVIAEVTYTPARNLAQTAESLEKNLHKKENIVYDMLNDATTFNKIKEFDVNHKAGMQFIVDFTMNKSIWLTTYRDGQIVYWSGAKVIPKDAAEKKDGVSFFRSENGYYESIKKSEGNFSAIFYIPVKNSYKFQNRYLKNTFTPDITKDNNIEIADFMDKGVYAVHDVNNNYLFSVKLKPGKVNNRFFYFEVTIWTLTMICLCVLVHVLVTYLANRGMVYLSLLGLALFIVLFRFINLYYGWPGFTHPMKLFGPEIYGSSDVYRSLGDFCVNILALTWFTGFLYTQRPKLVKNIPRPQLSYLIFFVCFAVLVGTSTCLLNLFNGLVINSKISFDVNNVLNLSGYSMLGVLMLCFSFLTFVLLTEIILTICFRLSISASVQTILFVTGILIVTLVDCWNSQFSLFYMFWAVIVLVRGYCYLYQDKRFTLTSFVTIIAVCAVISAVKLNAFQSTKEQEMRKVLIHRLEAPNNATVGATFRDIERQIISEPTVIDYFKNSDHTTDYLKSLLQKQYFDRYLSQYDFKVHEFDSKDNPLSADKNYSLEVFKGMVLYSSQKVSNYFYKQNESFGFQSYFAILPVIDGATNLGTVVIELRARPLQANTTFPELLMDKDDRPEEEFKDYSYAFYTDNKLIDQSGNYVYSVFNKEFKGKVKDYTFQKSSDTQPGIFNRFTHYSHLLYKPNKRNLIVVSRAENVVASTITGLTFFFVMLLAFGLVVLLIRLLWIRVRILNITNNRIKWNFKISFDRLLYKTRIQFSMIFAVVVTLVLVGIITFVSISSQYQAQQDRTIRVKIMQITNVLEAGAISEYLNGINDENRLSFTKLAESYAADLTIFDLQGIPILSTQPKIYEAGLLMPRMNGRAFISLNDQQQSEFVNEEKLGKLTYKAAYAPIRNADHNVVAYLQLPYFSNEADYTERIGSMLNIMINLYALVFIAIGLFAVIIARQITAPLNFIQYNLSRTIYGKKNEPIRWERNDEIGALVKEYNNMIAALENSANKLAQSERETAWREMAKQVAHEIKNPLTPLKLGLQLLDKSWKDKDPKFDQKFERFSKSFVEQIESLSSIASEFSAFAKMPDTRIERINLFEMLGQAVTIFKHMDNVEIRLQNLETPFIIAADRDQLLRCFNNLLKNAIEATPADRQCIIDINFLVTSKNVLLTIKDNGNGIPENMRDKIFEPNFTTKSSGTGLGLAFVKNSIENASGKIWFESNIGVGTTFYLNFPAASDE